MKLSASPVTEHVFNQSAFYLKRDDLLHSQFSGNKARKLATLLEADMPEITTLICYGSAQANSLYSLATLAKIKGWTLEFYVSRIPDWLKAQPNGNYRAALELDAKVIEVGHLRHPKEYIDVVREPDSSCLVLEEGARSPLAEEGVKQLAQEIKCWAQSKRVTELVVALPSGTGTTSLYLHKHLKACGIQVVTCACVGGDDYLTEQWRSLGEEDHPKILSLGKKHYFAHLYPEDYQIWQELSDQTYIEFDLLYDPLMWRCLQNWWPEQQGKTLLYIHQGGLLGNESMLPRYHRLEEKSY